MSRQGLPMFAAAALLLTAIIALAVWFSSAQNDRRAEIERDALEQARTIVALSDAEADADLRLLSVLTRSHSAIEGNLPRLEQFVGRAIRENPDWNALLVRDAATGEVLLEIAGDESERPNEALPPWLAQSNRPSPAIIREGRYCPCVLFEAAIAESPSRILSLFVAPEAFQRILVAHAGPPAVSALAMPDGDFVARSLDFARRVGTPGSSYLRRASARGEEGIYRGVTLEGLENYTAYASSPRFGWSAHVAVEAQLIDSRRGWSTLSMGTGILAALVLATGLVIFAIYEARRRRREELRLVGMQRAEVMSRFTGMLTHDFRNILAAVDAGVRLILKYTKEEQTEQRAKAIGEVVERGTRLVNQLLSFARGGTVEVTRIDLKHRIEATDELLKRSLGSGVAFSWRVDDDARFVRGNNDQLEFALFNLAVNARDAMNGHGEFAVTVTREGEFAAIAACDNGPGVPPHLRDRIFEAFYSTKEEGQGTGLGLAQVAGATRQAGGRVELRDNPRGGACFVLYLPLAEPPAR